MPEGESARTVFIPTHFCRDSALQFRAFARHSECRLTGPVAIQFLVLILFNHGIFTTWGKIMNDGGDDDDV